MRSSIVALALLLSAPLGAIGAEAEFVRVWPEYRPAESFERIREFFGRKESTGGRERVFRTQPEARGGYYFMTRVKTAEAIPGAMIALQVILPGSDEARVHFFPLNLKKGREAYLVGVTGDDWPGADVVPSAWQIRVLGPDGAELAREKSYLWELPDAPAAD